jgi:hypothetical protein
VIVSNERQVGGLLDAPPVKMALRQATAPLVLVISDEIYSGIVRHGYVDASTYFPLVWVRVAKRPRRGWVHIPAPVATPVVAIPVRGSWSAGASGSSVLTVADERAEYPVAAIIRRAAVTRAGPAG